MTMIEATPMLGYKSNTSSTKLKTRSPKSTFRILGCLLLLSILSVILETFELKKIDFYSGSRVLTSSSSDSLESLETCTIKPAKDPPPDIKPIFSATYPGSGSKMAWNLIEALTGYATGDEWFSNGRQKNAVSLKTHYPQSNGRLIPFNDEIDRVFLLIRFPMDAIPSYHNYVYEQEQKLVLHSTRAPVEVWTPWRDKYFDVELEAWKKSIIYWMTNYSPENRLVASYEDITDWSKGPGVARQLSEFLNLEPSVNIDLSSASCIWLKIVKYHDLNSPSARHLVRTSIIPDSSRKLQEVETTTNQEEVDSDENMIESNLHSISSLTSLIHSLEHGEVASSSREATETEVTTTTKTNSYAPNPASFRSGPTDKPFTMMQHTKILHVLRDLKTMFENDPSGLVDILDDYMERVMHSDRFYSSS